MSGLRAKLIDLGDQLEVIGYYPSGSSRFDVEKESPEWVTDPTKDKYEMTEEESALAAKNRRDENVERSVRRSKTQIRRVCRRYKLRYMWTFTFAKQVVQVKNPTNNRVTSYDVGEIDEAWKVWKLFLQRCRKNGIEFNYIVTVELQEKRLENYDQRCYHFHFATDSWIPQNLKAARKSGMKNYMTKFWTFGGAYVTKNKSSKRMANNYLMKYITKTFDENMTGRQRYRVREGLMLPQQVLPVATYEAIREIAESVGFIISEQQIELESGPPVVWYLIDKFIKEDII